MNSPAPSIKRNLIYNVIMNVLNVAFPVITIPYVSRVLGVHNIGVVSFATNYAAYFALFALLGIPIYGIREISKARNSSADTNRVFSEIFSISIISSAIVTVVYLLSVFLVPQLREQWSYLVVAGSLLYFCSFSIDWFFAGRENYKIMTIRSAIVKAICLAGMFIFVRERGDVMPYLVLTIFATLASNVWNMVYVRRNGLKIKLILGARRLRAHFSPLLVLFLSAVTTSIYTMLDSVLLGFMSDYSQVGYYTSAMKVVRVILPIVLAPGVVIMSRIAFHNEEGDMEQIKRLVSRSLDLLLVLAVPIAFGMAAVAPRFVPLFFGDEFYPTIIPMILLSSLVVIVGINNLFGWQVLVGTGRDKLFFRAVAMGMLLNICANLILIPRLGAIGTSIASVATELLIAIMVIWFSCKLIRIDVSGKTIMNCLVSMLPVLGVVWLFSALDISNFLFVALSASSGVVIYVVMMLYVFKNHSAKEIVEYLLKKKNP